MTSIKLKVAGARAWASVSGPLTSGMVGIPVTIEYDDEWKELTKNLVCRCGKWGAERGESWTILNVEGTAAVAHEVMKGGMYLYLGVEGYSADGKLVMPTKWANCGKIQYGANADGDPSANPRLSIWRQLQHEIRQLSQSPVTKEQIIAAVAAYLENNNVVQNTALTAAQIDALDGMFRVCAFTKADVSGEYATFRTAFGISNSGGGEEPDIPVEPDEPHTHSYTAAVTTPATCETAGVRTYTCSCGSSYTEEISATGHNYVDGTCANCGAADPDYEVSENNGWVNGEAYEIEWTAGYKLSSSGENVEDSSCSVSDYLPCYEVNRFEGTGLTSNYKYWFYDADKNFIGMSDVSMVYSGTGACARRGAYFVRVEAKTTNTAAATVTPHQDELLTESTVYEIGKNYRLKWTDGYYLDSNGHEIVGADHCVSDFAFCYGAVGITPGITERHFYYFYDADKNYISSYTYSNEKETIQIPANASYFRSFWGSTGFDQFVKLS